MEANGISVAIEDFEICKRFVGLNSIGANWGTALYFAFTYVADVTQVAGAALVAKCVIAARNVLTGHG